mmetsp:Transcript_8466/g.31276  ORF Transcript_8466/g.31276 Transcript_8466/m.31276 type:complete len:122 (-) Transcript_8466:447-812(-)
MAGLSFERQVELWSTSDVVVSPHGAHLQNALWMPKGGVILEMDAECGTALSTLRAYNVNELLSFTHVSMPLCTDQVYDVAGKPRLDLQRPFPENRSDKRDFVLTREQLATALAAGQKRIHA